MLATIYSSTNKWTQECQAALIYLLGETT